jgi:hypothetical protein
MMDESGSLCLVKAIRQMPGDMILFLIHESWHPRMFYCRHFLEMLRQSSMAQMLPEFLYPNQT